MTTHNSLCKKLWTTTRLKFQNLDDLIKPCASMALGQNFEKYPEPSELDCQSNIVWRSDFKSW